MTVLQEYPRRREATPRQRSSQLAARMRASSGTLGSTVPMCVARIRAGLFIAMAPGHRIEVPAGCQGVGLIPASVPVSGRSLPESPYRSGLRISELYVYAPSGPRRNAERRAINAVDDQLRIRGERRAIGP